MNSVIRKRMTNSFSTIGKSNFKSEDDSTFEFLIVSTQGADFKTGMLYFDGLIPQNAGNTKQEPVSMIYFV